MTTYNDDDYYKAHLTRDPRFDGTFFVAVKTTGIYCRPICPARKAKLENLSFYKHAVQAEHAGFRPCKRCRPESAPGSPAWLGTSTTVKRAINLMTSSPLENVSIQQLAERLGVSDRWLRGLFQQQIGVSPQALLLTMKLDIAKNLVDNSAMSMTDIAFASGFNSIRRFNDAFKKRFALSPTDLRTENPACGTQTLYLRYRPPMAWDKLMQFFAHRVLQGVEHVDGTGYQRLCHYQGEPGWFRLSLAQDNQIKVEFSLGSTIGLLAFVAKIKQLCDLEADPTAIYNDLAEDAALRPLLSGFEGVRLPGCFDAFELCIRAIVGQRVSVKAAITVLNRLIDKFGQSVDGYDDGSLNRCFPQPLDVVKADLSGIGLPATKIAAIKQLATLMCNAELVFDGSQDYDDCYQQLLSIKGVGHWTAEYIAMRALKNPDAFPASDLELQKQITKHQLDPKLWKPWRAYAAIVLFSQGLA